MIKQHFTVILLQCVLLWHLVTTNLLTPGKSCWTRPALGWEAKELIWSPEPASSLTFYSAFHHGATSQQALLRGTQARICQQRLNTFTLAHLLFVHRSMWLKLFSLERFLGNAEFRGQLPLSSLSGQIPCAQMAKPSLSPKELAGGYPLKAVASSLGAWFPT